MIGWSKMKKRLHDMTLHRMLSDKCITKESFLKRNNKILIVIRLFFWG